MAASVAPERPHRIVDVDTARGPARVFVVDPVGPSSGVAGTLVLGHGAGKGTNTPDLHALLCLADDGWRVVLVDQPWVVAGGRVATAPATLDVAWVAVVTHLRQAGEIVGLFVQGGRSAGARVACRTAADVYADAVVALAFPLMPAGKLDAPEKWRTPEARAVIDAGVPMLVVQGERDAFGGPEAVRAALSTPGGEGDSGDPADTLDLTADVRSPDLTGGAEGVSVIGVAGAHGFSKHPDDVVDAVRAWLPCLG